MAQCSAGVSSCCHSFFVVPCSSPVSPLLFLSLLLFLLLSLCSCCISDWKGGSLLPVPHSLLSLAACCVPFPLHVPLPVLVLHLRPEMWMCRPTSSLCRTLRSTLARATKTPSTCERAHTLCQPASTAATRGHTYSPRLGRRQRQRSGTLTEQCKQGGTALV